MLIPSHSFQSHSKTCCLLFYRSPHSVSVALKQWSQRKVSVKWGSIRKCRFLQCQRALKCFHKGSWGRRKVEEVFQQHCCPPSIQGKEELPGQVTKRPLQLLQCKPSIFPTAILPSTSSSSLHHSMSWLPLPTGSGRMGKWAWDTLLKT